MPGIARQGDSIGHGGIPTGTLIVTIPSTTKINNLPIIKVGDTTTCNWVGHLPATNVPTTVISGSTKTKVNSIPIARLNDNMSCGATIIFASPNVIDNA